MGFIHVEGGRSLMTPPDLVTILETLPEKKLAILTSVWELVDEDGQVDFEKAAFNVKDLQVAMEEARTVRAENNRLVEEIIRCCKEQNENTL